MSYKYTGEIMRDRDREKSDDEYREEFDRLHDAFIHGKGGFIADDYTEFRKKKRKSKNGIKKCKCKK